MFGEAHELKKFADQKWLPGQVPWADVRQAIDSTPTHTDADSLSELKSQSLLFDVYKHADLSQSSGKFNFTWLNDQLAAPAGGGQLAAVDWAVETACPAGTLQVAHKWCLFLTEPPCTYEKLLEEHWLTMSPDDKAYMAQVCDLRPASAVATTCDFITEPVQPPAT